MVLHTDDMMPFPSKATNESKKVIFPQRYYLVQLGHDVRIFKNGVTGINYVITMVFSQGRRIYSNRYKSNGAFGLTSKLVTRYVSL